MDKLIITGGKRLQGEVSISGAKNAGVAIIPAAIMANDICIIENLPHIEDIECLIETLIKMGAKCDYIDKYTLKIDSRNIINSPATYDAVKKIRASYYLLGALLGRFKKAEVAMPGGCDFGGRPIDQHIKGFEAMGATVDIEEGMIVVNADKLVGATVYLDLASVGATINIMFAAVFAEGTTVIDNAAKEPHVVDTANFLNSMGANVKGAGTDVIRITGVKKLHGSTYMIIPDQIEAGTYMIAAAITGGDVKVNNIIPKHMESLSAKLTEMGVEIVEGDDWINVKATIPLKSVNVKTMVYPGFPTDLQPQMVALLSTCKGVGLVTENIFDNRFQYVTELKRLGATIVVEDRLAVISGVTELSGAEVTATDLRAGAALVILGLVAKGKVTIGNAKYIDRGYGYIEEKLRALGADIERIKG